MKKEFIVIFISLILFTVSAGFSQNPPKTTDQLITRHADEWYNATHHIFLEKVKDGTLPEEAFSTWLAQDYFFASSLIDAQSLILVYSPRSDQSLLIGGLFALESELSWFEENATIYNIDLSQAVLPTAQKYKDFLLALQYKPYVVQIVCVWALEKAYFDSWSTALPGEPKYKEFIDRWTNEEFGEYVEGLETAANNALGSASKEDRALAEVYFLWIVRYEKDFWDMAISGE